MSRISDLLARRGDIEAARARDTAQIWGQTVAQLGQIPTTIAQMQQQVKDASLRQRVGESQLTTEGLQQQVAQGQIATATRTAQEDQVLRGLFARGTPTPEDVFQAVGPERGSKVAEGLKAFADLSENRVANARQTAGQLATGLKALPVDLQRRLWPSVRSAAITGGLGDETTVPSTPEPAYLDAVIEWATTPEQRHAAATLAETTRHNTTTEGLTKEEQAVRAAEAAAKRDYEWVSRGGRAMQIPKGTAQPGDRPYQPPSQAQPREPNYLTLVGPNGEQRRVNDGAEANALLAQGWKQYDAVAIRNQTGGSDAEALDTAREVQRIAKALRDAPGFAGTFGVISARMPTFRQDTADAEVLLNSLRSLLTLENTGKLKGVLSNADMELLRQASTTLAAQMGEPSAKAELNRLGAVMAKVTGQPWDGAPVTDPRGGGPRVGERRMINGEMGEWDGQRWVAVD